MKDAQHTPGPWHCSPLKRTWFPSVTIGGLAYDRWNMIVVNSCVPDSDMETHWANARLIAAAPELLAACKIALAYMEHDADDDQERKDFSKIQAAITKAEGQ